MSRMKIVLCTTLAALALSFVGSSFGQSVAAQVRAALVRDVDNPALQPFRASASVVMNFLNVQAQVAVVPAGKRLVIESVTYQGASPTNMQFIFAGLRTPQFGTFVGQIEINPPHASAVSNFFIQDGAQATRMYFEPGEEVWLSVSASSSSANAQMTVYVNGHFVTL